MEGIFRFQVLSVATLLVMGIIAVYSVLLPPPEQGVNKGSNLWLTVVTGDVVDYIELLSPSAV